MTGIERLREFVAGISPITVVCGVTRTSYDREHMEVAGKRLRDFLADIANQIEREQGERVSRVRILAVVTKMERHVLGHEGMEDSPVARWARELREALGGRDEEVTDVATVRKDAMEAWRWAREHGGLDAVKEEWHSRVPRDRYESRRQRLLDHIAECETALGRRNRRIAEMGKHVQSLTTENADMRKRLMPDGCEWPRHESGEMVRMGDAIVDGLGHAHEVSSVEVFDDAEALHWSPSEPEDFVWLVHGERVRRPAPKVLDADGVEIRVGDTVYHVKDGSEMTVYGIEGEWLVVSVGGRVRHDVVTHRAPVLAADGKPIREGETVYDKDTGDRFEVDGFSDGYVMCTDIDACESDLEILPSQLTHERPDSLDKLAEDIGAMVVAWRSNRDLFDAQEAAAGCVGENTMGAALDSLASRAKALAERGQ